MQGTIIWITLHRFPYTSSGPNTFFNLPNKFSWLLFFGSFHTSSGLMTLEDFGNLYQKRVGESWSCNHLPSVDQRLNVTFFLCGMIVWGEKFKGPSSENLGA